MKISMLLVLILLSACSSEAVFEKSEEVIPRSNSRAPLKLGVEDRYAKTMYEKSSSIDSTEFVHRAKTPSSKQPLEQLSKGTLPKKPLKVLKQAPSYKDIYGLGSQSVELITPPTTENLWKCQFKVVAFIPDPKKMPKNQKPYVFDSSKVSGEMTGKCSWSVEHQVDKETKMENGSYKTYVVTSYGSQLAGFVSKEYVADGMSPPYLKIKFYGLELAVTSDQRDYRFHPENHPEFQEGDEGYVGGTEE